MWIRPAAVHNQIINTAACRWIKGDKVITKVIDWCWLWTSGLSITKIGKEYLCRLVATPEGTGLGRAHWIIKSEGGLLAVFERNSSSQTVSDMPQQFYIRGILLIDPLECRAGFFGSIKRAVPNQQFRIVKRTFIYCSSVI